MRACICGASARASILSCHEFFVSSHVWFVLFLFSFFITKCCFTSRVCDAKRTMQFCCCLIVLVVVYSMLDIRQLISCKLKCLYPSTPSFSFLIRQYFHPHFDYLIRAHFIPPPPFFFKFFFYLFFIFRGGGRREVEGGREFFILIYYVTLQF